MLFGLQNFIRFVYQSVIYLKLRYKFITKVLFFQTTYFLMVTIDTHLFDNSWCKRIKLWKAKLFFMRLNIHITVYLLMATVSWINMFYEMCWRRQISVQWFFEIVFHDHIIVHASCDNKHKYGELMLWSQFYNNINFSGFWFCVLLAVPPVRSICFNISLVRYLSYSVYL